MHSQPTLRSLLLPERVTLGHRARSKEAVIEALLERVGRDEAVIDFERVRHDVWEREQLMPTGVGHALGLPHAKSPGTTAMVAAFIRLATPVDFGAPGGEPVRYVFLLVGPEQQGSPHVKVLSRIARLFTRPDFRSRIDAVATPGEALDVIEQSEQHLFD
jgi:mannitol/fructose-specific phosphotransferase system IIA component (Ntr-type)